MQATWSHEFSIFLERIFGEPQGSTPFMIIGVIALGSLVFFAWMITNLICSHRKGIFASFFSQAIPGFAAILGWIALHRHVSPRLEGEGLQTLGPIVGAILIGMVASLLTSRKILGISGSSSIVTNFLTYACVLGMIFLGGSLVREMDSSLHTLEHEKAQRETDTQNILQQNVTKSSSLKRN